MPGTVRKEPEPCRESHAETDPGQERRLRRPSLSHALIYQVREERHAVSRQEVRWQRGSDEPRALDVQVDALAVPGDPFAGVIATYIGSVLSSIQQWGRGRRPDAAYRRLEPPGDRPLGASRRRRSRESTSSTSTSGSRCSACATRSAASSPGRRAEELELDDHDRQAFHVRIAFAPLQNRPEAEEPDRAILLMSAERFGWPRFNARDSG